METIKVRKKYQITLPIVIREAAGVYEGDFLTAEVQKDRTILLRPRRLVDADEASADKASADKASGGKASGGKASGDKASGDKASGDKASADEASGNEAFFYTPEWQAAEREADEDLATGRYDEFETMADMTADLELKAAESSTSEA